MVKSFFGILAGILIGLLAAAVLWMFASPPRGAAVQLLPAPTATPLTIYITGEVASPGIYKLPKNSRIQDVIDAAGGLTEEANVNGVNLAARVSDGQQVDIPKKAPELTIGSETGGTPGAGGFLGAPININTAAEAELETLPGIGPTLAQRIVEYRTAFGFFGRIEDLMNVSGLGPATFEQIKPFVTVGP